MQANTGKTVTDWTTIRWYISKCLQLHHVACTCTWQVQ